MNREIKAGIDDLLTKATAARIEGVQNAGGVAVQGNQQLTAMIGRRYARIVAEPFDGQRSVYCFVDLANGDILKAAGWTAPARGARGNVLNMDAMHFDAHGGCFYRR